MTKSVIFLCVLLAVASTIEAVANGTIDEMYVQPWQAKLYMASSVSFFWPCGGTLISSNYVLTAARCFSFYYPPTAPLSATNVYIYLGAWNMAATDQNTLFISNVAMDDLIIHEGYNSTTYENDIALIKLPESINFTDAIQPAKLSQQSSVALGTVAHISGWQYPIREYSSRGQPPHGGEVTVVEPSQCRETYPEYVLDESTAFCAGGTVAFCYGDEGIGFEVDGEIVGMAYAAKEVITPSEECPILPQNYMLIAEYLDWIVENSDYQI